MLDGSWVDNYLLAGPDGDAGLWIDGAISRGALRRAVAERSGELAEAGLRAGGRSACACPPA